MGQVGKEIVMRSQPNVSTRQGTSESFTREEIPVYKAR